jgi:hypothetical protein
MPLVATRGGASASALGWSSAPQAEELGGMVLLTPTSIAYTGTSASIGANGSVEFSGCTSVSLNGIFGGDYNNYQVVFWAKATASREMYGRMRLSGTDNSLASSYKHQKLEANGTSITASRTTENRWKVGDCSDLLSNGFYFYFYGPALAQKTAFRSVTVNAQDNARFYESAAAHEVPTAYDGFTFYLGSDTLTGLVSVYGLVGA